LIERRKNNSDERINREIERARMDDEDAAGWM
jgi:hypothetical protein